MTRPQYTTAFLRQHDKSRRPRRFPRKQAPDNLPGRRPAKKGVTIAVSHFPQGIRINHQSEADADQLGGDFRIAAGPLAGRLSMASPQPMPPSRFLKA